MSTYFFTYVIVLNSSSTSDKFCRRHAPHLFGTGLKTSIAHPLSTTGAGFVVVATHVQSYTSQFERTKKHTQSHRLVIGTTRRSVPTVILLNKKTQGLPKFSSRHAYQLPTSSGVTAAVQNSSARIPSLPPLSIETNAGVVTHFYHYHFHSSLFSTAPTTVITH